MNKNHLFLTTALIALAALPATAQDSCEPIFCAERDPDCVIDLFGGQTIDAGDVTLSNDGNLLFIQVTTQDGWQFDTLHIYVGTEPVPTNGGGNVKPGQFPYSTEFDMPMASYTQVVDLLALGIDTAAPDCASTSIHIVVHAELIHAANDQEETGFAFGETEFPGRRWGWSVCYGVECDPGNPPPPADCDPFSQSQEEFEACCLLNPDDIDCDGPVG